MRLQPAKPALSPEYAYVETDVYKELGYDGEGQLTSIDYYEDDTKAVHLYAKALTYSAGLLVTITTTRIADSAIFTKTLNYDAEDQLVDVTA